MDDLVNDVCDICGKPVLIGQPRNGMTGNHWDCKKKEPLTKHNMGEYADKLTSIFGRVKLLCDGYEVTLAIEQSKMKLSVNTYVNGYIKGAWFLPKEGDDYPERKFLCPKTLRLYSPQKKARLIKQFGKKRANEYFKLDSSSIMYSAVWPSGKAALSHLIKVCDSVEVYVED